MCRSSRIWTCTPTASNRRLQVYVPYRTAIDIVVLCRLSYAAHVVVLELHKWEPYPNHHWKRFRRKPAPCIVNCPIGQWTDISSSFYSNLTIHLRCLFQVGDAYWIHLFRTGFLRSARWPLLHPISTQTICSETGTWFLGVMLFSLSFVFHFIRSQKSVQPDMIWPWTSMLWCKKACKPAWCSTNWATQLSLWSKANWTKLKDGWMASLSLYIQYPVGWAAEWWSHHQGQYLGKTFETTYNR